MSLEINLATEEIANFCQRHQIELEQTGFLGGGFDHDVNIIRLKVTGEQNFGKLLVRDSTVSFLSFF